MNRLPTEEWERDFGNRTDVLYLAGGNAWARAGYAMQMRSGKNRKKRNGELSVGDAREAGHPVKCNSTEDMSSGQCRFKALVIRGVPGDHGQFDDRTQMLERTWGSAPIPLGITRPEIASTASDFLKASGGFQDAAWDIDCGKNCAPQRTVTSGFMAMLTFAPLCESLDLYGFGDGSRGPPTADGHLNREDKHDYAHEHALLDEIAAGTLGGLDALWGSEHLSAGAAQWLKDNLLTRAGRIHKVD